MVCRFCGSEAVGRFELPGGCVCHPEDREQSLCMHHVVRASPSEGMILVEDFTVGKELTKWWADENHLPS